MAKCGDDHRGCFITINWWRCGDGGVMTVLRPLAQPLSVLSGLQLSLLLCLPPPSAITITSPPHTSLFPFRQFSHERLNNADSRDGARGQRMILYFLTESNMNHTAAAQTPPHRGRIGKCAVWRRTRISYFLYFLLSLRYCPHMELVKLRGSSRGWGQ